ncbi:hypothetical protein THAOC_33434 [Thalassiosira oceanica]|uniref:Carboxypeptidase n=1 Tax=Thalassiosira oceanica TaxID=159749 RepID=K0RM74_THAOC|nr:hypothetical protein THAOC_33434 [Thalassiosira oceanica]|eukprot:EJK47827.1 hypothetical protein THAOC_33434 [Thalassiosira oceanica]
MMITKRPSLSVAAAVLAFCRPPSSVAAGPVRGDASGRGSDDPFQGAMEKDAESFVFNSYTMTMSASKIEDPGFCDDSSEGVAGYMGVKGSKYDDSEDEKKLFFWMYKKRTASQNSADTDLDEEDTPLIVWLTGGPGCSSSLALLFENGPCAVDESGESTSVNPHSWTESANVLWLDQPANVGYSYGQDNDANESMISEDVYYFLQAFFRSEEGSGFVNSPLFIVGESYGGHYVPAIAHRIWRGNKHVADDAIQLNLQGLAVGNGWTDPEIQYGQYREFMLENGIIGEEEYDDLEEAQERCADHVHSCNSGDSESDFACQAARATCDALYSPFFATGLNTYDIRVPCGPNPLCYDFSHIETFMNSEDTKRKLNVLEHDPVWQTTFICNYLGNRAWTLQLEWKHDDDFAAAEEKDWNDGGGLVRSSNGFTFLQVYDAGHMVPTDQPAKALAMITQFIRGETF